MQNKIHDFPRISINCLNNIRASRTVHLCAVLVSVRVILNLTIIINTYDTYCVPILCFVIVFFYLSLQYFMNEFTVGVLIQWDSEELNDTFKGR